MTTDSYLDRQAGFRRFMAQFDPSYAVHTGESTPALADQSPTAQAMSIANEAYNPGTIQAQQQPAQPASTPLQMMSYQPSFIDAMLPKIGRWHAAQAAAAQQNAELNALAQNPNVTPDMINLAKTSPQALNAIAAYAIGQADPEKQIQMQIQQMGLDAAKKKQAGQNALQDYMKKLDQPTSSGPIGAQGNNPLNIRDNPANNWQGMTGANKGFVTFDKPEDAFRAGAKILNSYAARGINTLDDAIKTYAPASDGNDPEKYAAFVSKDTGISRDSSINLADPATQAKILGSMQKIEVGQQNAQPQGTVAAGVQAATPLQKYQQMAAHLAALDAATYGNEALAAFKPAGADGSNIPSSIQEANAYEQAKALHTPEGDQRAADIASFAKISGTMGVQEAMKAIPPGVSGDSYISALKTGGQDVFADTVKAVGNNDVNAAGLFSRGSIQDKSAIIAAVRQYNPNWNQRQYEAVADFNNGAHGDQVKFTSNVTEHLELSRELFKALDNGDIPMFNKMAQAWAQQTGSEVPTDFQSAVNIVGQEMVKSIVPSGGTNADREEAQSAFDKAKSPGQGTGAINTIEKLMKTQIRGNERQFINSTGGTHNDFLKLISPTAASILYPESKQASSGKVMNFDAQGNLIP